MTTVLPRPLDAAAAPAVRPSPGPRDLERTPVSSLPTRFGTFRAIAFRLPGEDGEHLALVKGDVAGGEKVLVRVHSSCLTGDVLGSLRCDCGAQLEESLRRVGESASGVILYLNQEGRGIGLANKLRTYALQDTGANTVEANTRLGFPVDARDYAPAARMLADLGVRSVRLLTNNPLKVEGLASQGVHVVERVPLVVGATDHNAGYLAAKRDLLGHFLDGADAKHQRS